MTKADLVEAIAKDANISKKAANDALSSVIDSITKALTKDDSVTITGFGTFKVQARAARTGVNPQTGEKIKIAARKAPVFKAGKALKDTVNK